MCARVATPTALILVQVTLVLGASLFVLLFPLLAVSLDVAALRVLALVGVVTLFAPLPALHVYLPLVLTCLERSVHVEADFAGNQLAVVLLTLAQLVSVLAGVFFDQNDVELGPSVLLRVHKQAAVGALSCVLFLLVIVKSLSERQACAANVHHVVNVVNYLVNFAIIVSVVVHYRLIL